MKMKNRIFVFCLSLLALLPMRNIAYFTMGQEDWISEMIDSGVPFEDVQAEYKRRWNAEHGNTAPSSVTTPAPISTPVPTPTSTPTPCSHTYTSELTTVPTCVEEGVRTFTCESCGDTYTMPEPATGVHDFVETVTKEATCTEKGVLTRTCSVCGLTETEDIEALGHDYTEEITTEPTCTEDGVKTSTCTLCGDVIETVVPKLGHTKSEWKVTTQAGLFTAGEQVIRCTTCGEILETQVIESRYPIWYLYAGIAVVVLAAGLVVYFIIRKKH